jgi:protein TonB
VKDATVVKSSHSTFERNAVQAVNKWKYQPQLRDGKPAESPGQQVVLRFKMEG